MTKPTPSTAVLLLAHGSPESPADVPAYMRNITGGRPISAEVMQEVRHRYELIGRSPLSAITRSQAEKLSQFLQMPVYVGMRNWHPYIADVVPQMLADGVTRAITICLAPQNSRTSVGLYRSAVEQAAGDSLEIDFVEQWHDLPLLIRAFYEQLDDLLDQPDDRIPVIFTAHSVPCRTICADATGVGDPYGNQAKQTAALVAREIGLRDDEWFFAFQSQAMSGGPGSGNSWIGPTVETTLDALATAGHKRVVIQPVGFVCDHVEVLYDIDIAFKDLAGRHGIQLFRTASLNDSPTFIAALAQLVRSRIAAPANSPSSAGLSAR